MRLARSFVFVAATAAVACVQRLPEPRTPAVHGLTPLEQLGRSVFFDRRLSLRGNQSCASCHAPEVGWTGDLSLVNAGPAVYEGSVRGRFGNRKPPTVAYAMAPVLHVTVEDGTPLFVGGHFWDGRATGERLGDPIAEQAQGPFVNPVEQALPDTGCVVRRVCTARYPVTLESQFPCSCGMAWPPDVTFDNLGVPPNPENPWYQARLTPGAARWVDNGLGAFLATRLEWRALADANMGKHKVPTLRNVDLRPAGTSVKAYTHNGYFKTLSGLVHFYNTRDVKPVCSGSLTERDAVARNCWPAPEVTANVNTDELGNLGLSEAEERAIVAFMGTLSDGFPRLGRLELP